MKVSITFDFGDKEIKTPSDIMITHSIEKRCSNLWFDPDMRDVIAGALAPLLSQLHMTENRISEIITDIYSAPVLFSKDGQDGYHYNVREHRLRHFSETRSPELQRKKTD